MVLRKKSKHINFVRDRMRELHNEITREFLDNEKPNWREMKFKKRLLKKYQRYIKLLTK